LLGRLKIGCRKVELMNLPMGTIDRDGSHSQPSDPKIHLSLR
jgi:hypothetical protein